MIVEGKCGSSGGGSTSVFTATGTSGRIQITALATEYTLSADKVINGYITGVNKSSSNAVAATLSIQIKEPNDTEYKTLAKAENGNTSLAAGTSKSLIVGIGELASYGILLKSGTKVKVTQGVANLKYSSSSLYLSDPT